MVMSLEGSIYKVSKAYSYYGRSNTIAAKSGCNPWIDVNPEPDVKPPTDLQVAPSSKVARSTPHQAAAAAAGATPASLAAETQDYYGGGYQDDNRVVYEGRAVVINGIVTAMSGPFKEKLDDGTFEHGLDFAALAGQKGEPNAVSGAVDPTVPFVQDKTYK
jgi:hypothetical protein